jgi:hypothetical protein
MKIRRFFPLLAPTLMLGTARLVVILALAVFLVSHSAAAQQPVVPKLTLSQVEGLVSNHVPDLTMQTQIQRRGLAFAPTPAIVESLRAKGAGPLTLAAISSAGTSKSVGNGEQTSGNGSRISGGKALSVKDRQAGIFIGKAAGIRWTTVFGGQGAVFSAADSSRIEYPDLIPSEGTLEFWINVNHGYYYDNFQFKDNQDDARIFSSDAHGGDVTWPGATNLDVKANGDITYWMAIGKGNQPQAPSTEARGTRFRFGQWHSIGISYGSQGQYIMLDGQVVASSPSLTQTFGRSGNQQQPLDIPTIGETVSHFWAHHRYEGGFDGVLAAFRVSPQQRDWSLALSPPSN